ncbi:MAG: type I restriction enzyme HsdR N-terminal domain-containing protein [Deltaproteobacteria bacterium]|nr:type I restriction enzyme HsdR N-terminal domain-containing protein [Deltaproteobacteria bacterium]
MAKTLKPYNLITDFVTGKKVPNIGAEENRQAVERYLVEEKGYQKEDIEVDADIEIAIEGQCYRSQIDLVVSVGGRRFMAIKCAAGSLESREREILSAARILDPHPLPRAVVTDGKTAIVLDTLSGKKITQAPMTAIDSRKEAEAIVSQTALQPLTQERLKRERLIFRAYDRLNVNVQRNIR